LNEGGSPQHSEGRRSSLGVALLRAVLFIGATVAVLGLGTALAVQVGIATAQQMQDLKTTSSLEGLAVAEGLLILFSLAVWRWLAWPSGGPRLVWTGTAAARSFVVLLPVLGMQALSVAAGDPIEWPSTHRIAVVALLAVAIAVAEEVAFRGVLVDLLGGWARPSVALILSALFFGALHIDGSAAGYANACAVALVIGVPFAVVRLVYNSLVGQIAIHAVVDFFALIALGGVDLPEPSLQAALVQIVVAAAIAGGYVAWFRSVARQRIVGR
jgi:membrane protease YdiL (CAAX protease family)